MTPRPIKSFHDNQMNYDCFTHTHLLPQNPREGENKIASAIQEFPVRHLSVEPHLILEPSLRLGIAKKS